jgi:membrane protein DedA with SNARE-associated domain
MDHYTDLIEAFLIQNGAYAPLLLLFLEEMGIPLPIPGDMVIAYAGYEITKGTLSYLGSFLLLLFSVILGSSVLYYLSARFGQKIVLKFGRFLHINENKLGNLEKLFRKYGYWVIIFGRHVPGFRIPITIFSGMSKINFRTFILSTLLSVIFWIPFYLALGQKLGPKTISLLHGHYLYFLLALLPFFIFLIYLFRTSFQRKS